MQQQTRRNSKQLNTSKEKPFTRFDFENIDKCINNESSTVTTNQQQKIMGEGFEKIKKLSTSIEKDDSIVSSCKSPQAIKYDVSAATFLDVAVLRCLFISHWQEDGIDWSLRYMDKRFELLLFCLLLQIYAHIYI